MKQRLRALFCRHVGGVHLCQPPSGVPSLIICIRCGLLLDRFDEEPAGMSDVRYRLDLLESLARRAARDRCPFVTPCRDEDAPTEWCAPCRAREYLERFSIPKKASA